MSIILVSDELSRQNLRQIKKWYVYKITNIITDRVYIGYRGHVAPEKDLGIEYFSSSGDYNFIDDQLMNTNNYNYEILFVFNNQKQAVFRESQILEDVDAQNNKDYYNNSNGCNWYYDSTGSKWITNGKHDIKINKNNLHNLIEYQEQGFVRGRSFNGAGAPNKNKMAVHKYINEKTLVKFIYRWQLDYFINNGWKKGSRAGFRKFNITDGKNDKNFRTVEEQTSFLNKNETWRIGQSKRSNFGTDGIVVAYDKLNNKNINVIIDEFNKNKHSRYISATAPKYHLDIGQVRNEYDDILFSGYYGEINEMFSHRRRTNTLGELQEFRAGSSADEKIKIWSDGLNYISLKVKWVTITPFAPPIIITNTNKKQLRTGDIKDVRNDQLKEQNYICPICTRKIKPGDETLDHCHDSGYVRGVLCKVCNAAIEGGFSGKYIRSGISKTISFEDILKNLLNYLTDYKEIYLHPSHEPRPRKLMKSSYNNLKREIEKANQYLKKPIRVPVYPKSKRLTKKLKELYEQFGMFPLYYSKGK